MGRKSKDVNTICWGCKRAVNSPDCTCSWASKGTPVIGWRAKRGSVFQIPIENSDKKISTQSYIVLSCPLYIRSQKYLTIEDVIETLTSYFHCGRNTIRSSLKKKMVQYEQETGDKFPLWVKYYLKDKEFNL